MILLERLVQAAGEVQNPPDAALDDERQRIELERPVHLEPCGIEPRPRREEHRVPLARRGVPRVELQRPGELFFRARPVPVEPEPDEGD